LACYRLRDGRRLARPSRASTLHNRPGETRHEHDPKSCRICWQPAQRLIQSNDCQGPDSACAGGASIRNRRDWRSPLYNQDHDDAPPPPYVAFREQIKAADAVLFVTPEDNRSVPGVLKNAIDVGSRPYGHSAWDRKPGAVISVSPGAIGGFGANHHLRQSLVFLNVPAMPQPEAYIAGAGALFDKEGSLTNEGMRKFLKKLYRRLRGVDRGPSGALNEPSVLKGGVCRSG